MLTSRFEEFLRNFNWNQRVHSFQPWRAHPPDEPEIFARMQGEPFDFSKLRARPSVR
jgi:hypothetical protein